jgi:hypothetical protein
MKRSKFGDEDWESVDLASLQICLRLIGRNRKWEDWICRKDQEIEL